MENDSAFLPSGLSYLIAGAASPPTPIQIGGPSSGSPVSVRIMNSGTVLAGVSFAPSAALATTNAVIPTAGTPQQCFVMLPGSVETITVPPGQWWTAVASIACTIYVQTGYGV